MFSLKGKGHHITKLIIITLPTNITFKSNMCQKKKRTEKNPLMVHKNMIWQRKPMSMSVTSVIRSRTNSWLLVFNTVRKRRFCSLCLQRKSTTLKHPANDAVTVSLIF